MANFQTKKLQLIIQVANLCVYLYFGVLLMGRQYLIPPDHVRYRLSGLRYRGTAVVTSGTAFVTSGTGALPW